MPNRIHDLLDFWIGPAAEDPAAAKKRGKLWYQSSPAADSALRAQFGTDLELAETGALANWQATPDGALALVILLDQFSRNLHRGTAKAFANDPEALRIAEQVIDAGADESLSYIGRAFLYHPFEHAESVAAQHRSVALFNRLHETATAPWRDQLKNFADYAVEHRDVILKFGRFPHRNQVLGRSNTEEEQRYLDEGARRYGQ